MSIAAEKMILPTVFTADEVKEIVFDTVSMLVIVGAVPNEPVPEYATSFIPTSNDVIDDTFVIVDDAAVLDMEPETCSV
jgi:hypothetical protein